VKNRANIGQTGEHRKGVATGVTAARTAEVGPDTANTGKNGFTARGAHAVVKKSA
jgi:hypothetical protein